MKISIIDCLTLQDHIETAKIEENYFDKKFIAQPTVTQKWYNQNKDTYILSAILNTRKASLFSCGWELFVLLAQ